ncbi:PAQR family membrane homeostasis protein TrhA [Acidimangrovimonas sediminis]|uniref:PAQR family membrane homeostasis protein TrhA n=1 Tax=Acidimangrovimonas sediminis TaxID=2056283 RepID=UPI000C7FE418|nr:hemolysin III family protein [Acidimangrovimonas sediminis]
MSATPRTSYSRAERVSDAIVHISGVAAMAVAVPVLIGLTIWRGADPLTITAVAIYGTTLLAMLGFSALYNTLGQRRWHGLLRRLDHSAIYAKIAGTYTPFTLIPGTHGGLLAALWITAAAGMVLKLISPGRLRWLALALYLGMGWAGIAAGGALLAPLSPAVIALIIIGGATYTAGVVFYLVERMPFHYTLWHVFVLAASAVFYAAVTTLVVQSTA